MPLNILVIHGYAQSAKAVAENTSRLSAELSNIATLDYVDGPPLDGSSAPAPRPWWILDSMKNLEFNKKMPGRWGEVVSFWSELLSSKEYDGIIGISQGAAMAALLLAMVNDPAVVADFQPRLRQQFKFAILCSGYISNNEPHKSLYSSLPTELPTFHTVDMDDTIVSSERTLALQGLFKNSKLFKHSDGHMIPVQGEWPIMMKAFIIEACGIQPSKVASKPRKGWLLGRSH